MVLLKMKMQAKKAILSAALLGIMAVSGQCGSIAEPGAYIGFGLGYSMSDIDSSTVQQGLCGGDCSAYTDDENSLGFKVFGGYMFNEYFSVEGGYFNLGRFSYEAVPTTGPVTGEYKVQGTNLDLLLTLPLHEAFSVTARSGLLYSRFTESYSHTGTLTKNSMGFKYGLGFQYDFDPAWALRGELENYHLEEPSAGGADVQLISFGLVYRFGIEEEPEPEPVVIIKEVEVVKVVEVAAEPIVIVEPAPPAERIILASDALFDFDKADLIPQGQATLVKLARNIKETDQLIITGHTDDVGSESYNLELAQRRADAVRDFLLTQKIASGQIETISKGESEPIADNATDEGRAANRRVEFKILTTTEKRSFR